MAEQPQRYRIHSHLTRSRFLHVEDALDIGKVRLYAGEYKRGEGASSTAAHFLDVADARVMFSDLAWGKAVDYIEYKGTANGDRPTSRVLKVKTNGGKVLRRPHRSPGPGRSPVAPKPCPRWF